MAKLISFEGTDGVGKTSNSLPLAERLTKESGVHIPILKFPMKEVFTLGAYGTTNDNTLASEIWTKSPDPFYPIIKDILLGKIDKDPYFFQYLMSANRYMAQPYIKKLMKEKPYIIFDRYTESAYAYGIADGLPLKWLIDIHSHLIKPDIVILLTGYIKSDESDIHEKNRTYLDKVELAYKEVGEIDGHCMGTLEECYQSQLIKKKTRWIHISNDGSPIKATHERIYSSITKVIGDKDGNLCF